MLDPKKTGNDIIYSLGGGYLSLPEIFYDAKIIETPSNISAVYRFSTIYRIEVTGTDKIIIFIGKRNYSEQDILKIVRSYINQDLRIIVRLAGRYKKMVPKNFGKSYLIKREEYETYKEGYNEGFLTNSFIKCWPIVEKEEYLVVFGLGDSIFDFI